MVTESPKEYRHRAEECERLSKIANNTEVRETLLYLAKRWRDFAADAEVNLKRSQAYPPLYYPSG
jgi:hypothetical protein